MVPNANELTGNGRSAGSLDWPQLYTGGVCNPEEYGPGIGQTQDPEFWESKLPHVLFAGLFLRQIRTAVGTDFCISCTYSLALFEQIELDNIIKMFLFPWWSELPW